MVLQMYGVKDAVSGQYVFFFQADNDGVMKRVVKSALLDKNPNVITTDLKDKSIYNLGELDNITGEIKPNTPVYCVNVSDVRLELIKEIKIAKAEAGVEKPEANEVCKDE